MESFYYLLTGFIDRVSGDGSGIKGGRVKVFKGFGLVLFCFGLMGYGLDPVVLVLGFLKFVKD